MQVNQFQYSRTVAINLLDSSDNLREKLIYEAMEGYKYAGISPLMTKGIFMRTPGTYGDQALLRLEPAKINSFFSIQSVPVKSSVYSFKNPEALSAFVNELSKAESWVGYSLVDIIPVNGFLDKEVGSGTVTVVCIFEWSSESGLPLMLDRHTIKPMRPVGINGVSCPVKGCGHIVPYMDREGVNLDNDEEDLTAYICPYHNIYILPSTYSYVNPETSILWKNDLDKAAIDKLLKLSNGKRTWKQIAKETNADALAWNTFRYLQRTGRIDEFLEKLLPNFRRPLGNKEETKIIYWSIDLDNGSEWEPLKRVRVKLGQVHGFQYGPDVIVVSPNEITLLNVKFMGQTLTKREIPDTYTDQYKVFNKPIKLVHKYIGNELLENFLIGQELSIKLKRPFRVVTLTRPNKEKGLQQNVKELLSDPRQFVHINWLDVYTFVQEGTDIWSKILARYLEGKTAGYDLAGRLQTLLGIKQFKSDNRNIVVLEK
ncbi:MAG: hypothetical protein PWP31_1603 [Clostridia bacterium]|nr:hypothetical protein [Clostridia bacterium]